jgi:hypothetical protein
MEYVLSNKNKKLKIMMDNQRHSEWKKLMKTQCI